VKLLRLKAEGFGPLRGDYTFDPERVAIVVDRNEAGKSSLLSAISAALYGLAADKRSHRVLTPLERWRPWEGETYRVELEFESEGSRYVVKRDFARGTVEVWNASGQEVAAEFREGKDEFPIGKRLLGLDAAEFEKCALVRQSELDLVVPGDEKVRRSATLNARLESAADTRGGDTSASEAVRVLAGALRKYHSQELGFEGTVEVAIQRLEAKRELLSSELRTLEHDLAQVAGPLEELARVADEERETNATLARLDGERRESLAAGVRQQLEEHTQRKTELDEFRAEAEALSASAHLPANADAELRETVTRIEGAQQNLDLLESRRRDAQAKERAELEASLQTMTAYAAAEPADADRCVTLAAELRRSADEERRLRDEAAGLRATLTGSDYEAVGRAQAITARFEPLSASQTQMLREQGRHAQTYQGEIAELEPMRATSSETLREIDSARGTRRLPGWFLVALGLAALFAAVVVMAIHGEARIWGALIAGGIAGAGAGAVLLTISARMRRDERETALRDLTDASRRLQQIRTLRAEGEVEVADLARGLGYRDAAELMRDWNEYVRLHEESAPALRAREQLDALETRRRETLDEARALLDRLGGGAADPSHLDRVAAAIRHLTAVRQRLVEVEKSWSWIDEERRVVEATAAGLKERAVRILQSAGLTYDPSRPWADHVAELGVRLKGGARHQTLLRDLIPQAEQRLLPETKVAELRRELAAIEYESDENVAVVPFKPADGAAPRTQFELEKEARTLRNGLELLQRKRVDLRLKVDEVCRKHALEHPEKTAVREAIEQALEQAKRFRRAVDMATETIQSVALDTHRRWADFLNQRVPQLLELVGARVEQLRFGDDLDFSVKLWNGQQISRGKAVLQLSAGARDQLHLAVRLAISEFLSRPGDPMPLLLDDVFATSDDERTRAGMRLLIEHFARHHQIIVVTCHRHRHEKLAVLDPDLYASGVQWLDAGAPTLAE
jgi:AAA domain